MLVKKVNVREYAKDKFSVEFHFDGNNRPVYLEWEEAWAITDFFNAFGNDDNEYARAEDLFFSKHPECKTVEDNKEAFLQAQFDTLLYAQANYK
jgi:hypothetical protein